MHRRFILTAGGLLLAQPALARTGPWFTRQRAMEFGLQRGPLDIAPGGVAFAYSCARLINRGYRGPLVRLARSSDSKLQQFFPDAKGLLDFGTALRWAGGSTLTVNTLYDQSANRNDAVNATVANQPSISLGINGRPAMLFTNGGATALSAPAITATTDIFFNGGMVLAVAMPTANPNQANVIGRKLNAGVAGWSWGMQNALQDRAFLTQGGSTSQGTWSASANGTNNVPHVMDVQYAATSVSTTPTMGQDGTNLAFTSIQPVGTITSDSAAALVVGSNAVTGGTRGFPGWIAEFYGWKVAFSQASAAALRRNCENFFSVGGQ